MVFSQTDANPQSFLKVVELNLLKNRKVNGTTGAIIGGGLQSPIRLAPVATTSFSEVRDSRSILLKPEPQFESTMFHETDSELFRDLTLWCVQPAEETVQTGIDGKKTQERAHTTDTLHTPISPQGWDNSVANSPGLGFHYSATNDPLSPNLDMFPQLDSKLMYPDQGKKLEDLNWEIETMPIVIEPGTLAPEVSFDWNPCSVTGNIGSNYTQEYTPTTNTHNTFIMDEDSSDIKLDTVIPTEVEYNDTVIRDYVINEVQDTCGVMEPTKVARSRPNLSLSMTKKTSWSGDIVSTPEILDIVSQLKEGYQLPDQFQSPLPWPLQPDPAFAPLDVATTSAAASVDYEPITPKTESPDSDEEDTKHFNNRKRHRNSEDSDEPYTPYPTRSTRKIKKRKLHVPIRDLIQELQEAQPKDHEKPKRGRPPKRRDSAVSSVHSADDNASTISTHEIKYRELRDKNNEASKRSRMNRKLKELQMEQLAVELEDRNKKLKVRADILEDMTKRMKEALMSAILQK